MMKKVLSAIIFIGILLITLACLGGAATEQAALPTEERGIYMAADGSGVYINLETAIEKVEPGATLELDAGTYQLTKRLVIEKPITLIGSGRDETIITFSTDAVINFKANGLFKLEDITVKYEGTTPGNVVVVDRGKIDFSNCRLTGAVESTEGQTAGLFVTGNTTGVVRNCIIDNNSLAGIFLAGESNLRLEENDCSNNGVGIGFRENAGGQALNNTCNNNQLTGFYLLSDGEITLKDNECSRNGTEGDASGGIMVRGTTSPTLDGNTCTDNPFTGILYGDTSGGEAVNNKCSQNGFSGIFLEAEAAPVLEGNTCNQNGTVELGAGIVYFQQSGGVASKNVTSRNNMAGIFVGADAAPELNENDCSENTDYGIFYRGGRGSATKNQCTSNGKVGIAVTQDGTPLLEENICTKNQGGIYVEASANPELVNNDLYENSQDDLVDLRP
jgi:parallel beta-helix repeat protein